MPCSGEEAQRGHAKLNMVTAFLRRFFRDSSNGCHEKLMEMKALPDDQKVKELGRFLYETCAEQARSFVREEFSRAESPFQSVPKDRIFQEVLTINIWLAHKKFSKKNKEITDELHSRHQSFRSASTEEVEGKYEIYRETWDDDTGHQDRFGAAATRFIFGDGCSVAVDHTSFWIISHAHDSLKVLSNIRGKCRELGIAD